MTFSHIIVSPDIPTGSDPVTIYKPSGQRTLLAVLRRSHLDAVAVNDGHVEVFSPGVIYPPVIGDHRFA
jgi:hypothetical protein